MVLKELIILWYGEFAFSLRNEIYVGILTRTHESVSGPYNGTWYQGNEDANECIEL
jgi:hypothetical protein